MPKYSIILPIYNSAKYIKSAIDSVLSCNYDDYEFIISNNCSTDTTEEILSQIHDKHIKIIQPTETLPLGAHWNFAIKHAKGEWLWALGADDAMCPYFFELCDKLTEYCDKHKLNIINSNRALYIWPGVENHYGNNHILFYFSNSSKILNTQKTMKRILTGKSAYVDMPQMYTSSLFRRNIIQKAEQFSKTGDIIPYNVPAQDSYLGILAGMFEKKYLYTDIPLGWVGSSPNSICIKNDKKIISYNDSPFSLWSRAIISSLFNMHLSFVAFQENNTIETTKYKKELNPLNILSLIYYKDLYKLDQSNSRLKAFWDYVQSLGIEKNAILTKAKFIERKDVKTKWYYPCFNRIYNYAKYLLIILSNKKTITFQFDNSHYYSYSEINNIILSNNIIKSFFHKSID